MTTRRLLELWEPPQGYRLASAIATTYELQADFFEEDLLPVALDLRTPPARGRDFRLELERALQDTEISVFFHPGRYQPGLRRSPRVDLVPLPEGRFPKLHAKVALLRCVSSEESGPASQLVRLIVGSANLTASGYRSNIEVAVAVDDMPGCMAEASTAVRDATAWLENLVGSSSEQVTRQLRDIKAVFASRSATERRKMFRFLGLPSTGGLPALMKPAGTHSSSNLKVASPFWPSGDDLSDVANALKRLSGGAIGSVSLIGPPSIDDVGSIHPVIPAALVTALLRSGAKVFVAAADPRYGCSFQEGPDDEGEFDSVAENHGVSVEGSRSLHAKVLIAEGAKITRLAIGSFNLTRRGMGLVRNANAEAGLLWTLPNSDARALDDVVSFATAWRQVDRAPGEFVVEPGERTSDDEGGWPAFLLALRARRTAIDIKGDTASWPSEVTMRMRDIRGRLLGEEQWFDAWVIRPPELADTVFTMTVDLRASWIENVPKASGQFWRALPDLEVEVSWNGRTAIVPVMFEDKHLFPVVENRAREDEQTLIAWFLGLRPAGEAEDGGFGHSIDPLSNSADEVSPTNDILSYLIRDFVHALPGIKGRLADAGLTETGLRAALLGNRSPVELAREARRALKEREKGKPHKTVIATAFQLTELRRLLEAVILPEFSDAISSKIRNEALLEVNLLLNEVLESLPPAKRSTVLRAYLRPGKG
jgi:hypothetical protein